MPCGELARSIASYSSRASLIVAAIAFSSRCATDPVPGIGSIPCPRRNTQAIAIWPGGGRVWRCAMPAMGPPGPLRQRRHRSNGSKA